MSDTRAMASIMRYAEGYLRRGLAVVPIPEGRKRPVIPSWQTLRLRLEELDRYFNGRPQNIGILLGELSGWVVDVDLDAREAVALAPRFLPPTLKSGREGARTERWKDTNGLTLLELRSTGCQTVVEPSTHPEGDRYLWHHEEGSPAEHVGIAEVAREELTGACRLLATAALVARRLPPVGGRHDFALALPGFCKSATLEEIRAHGHVLTPGRYVGAEAPEEDAELFEEKMQRLTARWREQQAEARHLDAAIEANLKTLGYTINE